MTRIPNSKTVVSYAYTIKVNGTPIGTLQGFNPGADRKLERVREIMNEIDDTKEIVPGRTDYTISINRLETYDADMLQALGLPRLATLHELTDPIDIIEEIQGPTSSQRRVISYNKCVIQSINKTIQEGNITVSQSVVIWPTSITVLP
jgi:hypothetical protein